LVLQEAGSWLYDQDHELLWTLFDGVLSVADLRLAAAPLSLATGLDEIASIWVEWPPTHEPRFVRTETGCESVGIVEVQMRSKPTLQLIPGNEHRRLLDAGVPWLKAQLV